MKNRENKNGLKGQYNLAQGFGVSAQSNGNTLGCETGNRIVRVIRFIGEEFLIRTREMTLFSGNDVLLCRPKRIIGFDHRIHADGFSSAFITPGDAWGWDKPTFQAGKMD